MRQKRAKSYRKQMLVYNHTFKFRQPYQVLVDDQLVLETFNSSFDLVKGLKRTLQAEVKPMITQCCMQQLYESRNQGAIDAAKEFERRRCNHNPKDPKSAEECLLSVVNVNGKNKHRYVVATQDVEIRRKLRKVPGVPLVYMNRSVMVMEPLSTASEKVSQEVENAKLYKGLNDAKYAGIAHNEEEAEEKGDGSQENKPKKRKGPKEPNPLSMKKKKKVASTSGSGEAGDHNGDSNTASSANGETSSAKRRRRRHRKASEEAAAAEAAQAAQEAAATATADQS
ncbi:rRNA-processing protein UTP23 [Kluyveromyces marxianus]|uniref:U three protein 23 n=2 Tax=Kluyveromyces marxianus TaxID=4911 RepID=W0THR4_KLUMD|nr:rRNA-processing protein UTP23 [Kluyveromyces marxianus DMKU3-1042]QGN17606.1 rRNA-processing protein UTP23 [Kluyveromyces marxianus]BAO42341.1 rRNA-processing protein UTP23 [Kluyveromyces marxianus DMKU3-1042]BAP73735.1 rRNA-processing protein UTP23 [Kluyveromyces marxianus]